MEVKWNSKKKELNPKEDRKRKHRNKEDGQK